MHNAVVPSWHSHPHFLPLLLLLHANVVMHLLIYPRETAIPWLAEQNNKTNNELQQSTMATRLSLFYCYGRREERKQRINLT